jgi:hypothetical protein
MRWFIIIGVTVLSLALGGCSVARLGYNNAPSLLYYWLDSYFDFDSAQTLAMREKLQALQDWHRKEELPQIADLLKNLQPSAGQNVTPEQVCRLYGFILERAQTPLNYLSPAIASLAVTLSQAQITHIQAEFDKRNQQWREEWLDVKPPKRLERRQKQIKDQAEMFYGRLSDAQTAQIKLLLETAGYDPQRQYAETLRRQQDSITVLNLIRTSGLPQAQATAEIQNLFARSFVSPDLEYRRYAEQARQLSCNAIAQLHNSTSTEQREKMLKTLIGYEADARALMSNR